MRHRITFILVITLLVPFFAHAAVSPPLTVIYTADVKGEDKPKHL